MLDLKKQFSLDASFFANDLQIHSNIGNYSHRLENIFSLIPGAGDIETRVLNVNNVSFTYPSSPLLTQGADVPEETLCSFSSDDDDAHNENETSSPSSRRCHRGDGGGTNTCECVHIRRVPLGATVEIILLDQGN